MITTLQWFEISQKPDLLSCINSYIVTAHVLHMYVGSVKHFKFNGMSCLLTKATYPIFVSVPVKLFIMKHAERHPPLIRCGVLNPMFKLIDRFLALSLLNPHP